MNKLKEIGVSVAVLLFTVLNIYNLERAVPIGDRAYDNYAYQYLMYMSASFIIIMFCYVIGRINRFIKALLIINTGAFLILFFKSYYHLSYKHNFYDITILGCFVIAAISYLISKHLNDILIIIKAVLNQLHMKWQHWKKRSSGY